MFIFPITRKSSSGRGTLNFFLNLSLTYVRPKYKKTIVTNDMTSVTVFVLSMTLKISTNVLKNENFFYQKIKVFVTK